MGGLNSRANLTTAHREALAKKAAANRWKQPMKSFSPPALPGVIWLWARDGTLNEILATANAARITTEIKVGTSGPRQYALFASFDEFPTKSAADRWCRNAIEFLKPADQA
jgi:hypothetical protein